jgi:intracellular septation protein A
MKIFLQAARPLLSDLLATLVFAGMLAATHDARAAAGLALASGLVQLAWSWRAGRAIGALQWVSLGLVVVFGAMTFVTRDARFMMFKPTLIYAIVAGAMLERGWMLRYIPPEGLAHIPEPLVVRWGYAWAALMALTAGLNAAIAGLGGFAAWTLFISVFPLASKATLFLVQYAHLHHAAVRRARQARAA